MKINVEVGDYWRCCDGAVIRVKHVEWESDIQEWFVSFASVSVQGELVSVDARYGLPLSLIGITERIAESQYETSKCQALKLLQEQL